MLTPLLPLAFDLHFVGPCALAASSSTRMGCPLPRSLPLGPSCCLGSLVGERAGVRSDFNLKLSVMSESTTCIYYVYVYSYELAFGREGRRGVRTKPEGRAIGW